MLKAFLRAIGLVSKEYHHIVDSFHKAINDLNDLENRKIEESERLAAKILADTDAKAVADQIAARAAATAKNISALVGA